MQLNTWQMTAAGSLAAFALLCWIPLLHRALRAALRPLCIRLVSADGDFVASVQRSFRRPWLDRVEQLTSWFCGVEFYTTFLPILFFMGEVRLAFHFCVLLTLALYLGNATKDVICSPRPPSPPVSRMGETERDEHKLEYGAPSTHTCNTLALALYFVLYRSGHTALSSALAARGSLDPLAGGPLLLVVGGLALWTANIVFGRVYLGMHSRVDLVAGAMVGLWIVAIYASLDAAVDAMLTSPLPPLPLSLSLTPPASAAELAALAAGLWDWFLACGPAQLVALCLAAVNAYPRPLDRTPSHKYVVYFSGVLMGLLVAARFPLLHPHGGAGSVAWPVRDDLSRQEALARGLSMDGWPACDLTEAWGWVCLGRRLLIGVPLVLGGRVVGKPIATLLLRFTLGATASLPLPPWLRFEDHEQLRDQLPRSRLRSPSTTCLDAELETLHRDLAAAGSESAAEDAGQPTAPEPSSRAERATAAQGAVATEDVADTGSSGVRPRRRMQGVVVDTAASSGQSSRQQDDKKEKEAAAKADAVEEEMATTLDLNTAIRLLTYMVVSWAVLDPSFAIFQLLGV